MEILRFAKALADETRVRLIRLLMDFELNVGEIVQIMGMGQSRVSRHLKILVESGLAASRRDGLWTFYAAVSEGRGRLFLDGAATFFEDGGEAAHDLEAARRMVSERSLMARRFFDEAAPVWQDLSREILGDFDLAGKVAELLPGCGAAADLGCGAGTLLSALAAKAERVIGVDYSPKMLEAARERFAGDARVSLRIGELEHLPLRDAEADCVLLSMALHHLSSPMDGLAEAARVLSPGGTILIADFDRHENEDLRRRHGDRRLGFAEAELGAMLEQTNFTGITEVGRASLSSGLTLVFTKAEKPGA
jgi:SAM-dependent methyltransferase